jgi:hypothetical protein
MVEDLLVSTIKNEYGVFSLDVNLLFSVLGRFSSCCTLFKGLLLLFTVNLVFAIAALFCAFPIFVISLIGLGK